MTDAQALLARSLRASSVIVQTEVKFHPVRRWRIDVTAQLPQTARQLAIEIDGGVWVRGRHTRGAGVIADNEKIAHIAMAGYLFLRVTPQQVQTGQAYEWALRILYAS